jgi:hypothetical protein
MKKYLSKTSWGRIVLLFLSVSFLLSGCVGASGKLQFNPALLDQYRGGALSKTYQYYYCGRSTIPYAVVGIDDAYGFNDRLWFKIESEQAVYEKISKLSQLHIHSGPLTSSDILDGEGKKVGVWFSYYRYSHAQVDSVNRMVEVFNPYNPNEDSRGGF